MKNLPDLKLHTKTREFFLDMSVPMWMKIIHLFIFTDSKAVAKNGYTIYMQNPYLVKRFSVFTSDGELIWEPSLASIQQSIAKLEHMGLLERTLTTTGERRIKLNRSYVVEFLRQQDLSGKMYQSFKRKSRERKLIRRKIISVVDYMMAGKHTQAEQFRKYLEYQHRKYGYDISVPDIDIFEIDFNTDLFVSKAELEYYKDYANINMTLDAIYDKM